MLLIPLIEPKGCKMKYMTKLTGFGSQTHFRHVNKVLQKCECLSIHAILVKSSLDYLFDAGFWDAENVMKSTEMPKFDTFFGINGIYIVEKSARIP